MPRSVYTYPDRQLRVPRLPLYRWWSFFLKESMKLRRNFGKDNREAVAIVRVPFWKLSVRWLDNGDGKQIDRRGWMLREHREAGAGLSSYARQEHHVI